VGNGKMVKKMGIKDGQGEWSERGRELEPSFDFTGWAKKRATLLLSISSPIIDRFSKFFHYHTL